MEGSYRAGVHVRDVRSVWEFVVWGRGRGREGGEGGWGACPGVQRSQWWYKSFNDTQICQLHTDTYPEWWGLVHAPDRKVGTVSSNHTSRQYL